MASLLSDWQQVLRDKALWSYGYFQGRSSLFPRNFSDLYRMVVSKATSFVALPLPLLSFLALPVFGGTSTSFSLVFVYLTWSSLVFAHDPLSLEIYGTLAVRVLFFLLPSFAFLAFDCVTPSLSKNVKAYGGKNLPTRVGNGRLAQITSVAVFNVLLSVALQAISEVLFTEVFHVRSILKVTSFVPLPWSIAKDVVKGLALRGALHYYIHRYLLHGYESSLKTWHLQWQHSIQLPYSLAAAYDHPVCHILVNWLPDFLPAYLFRFHVLTWHIFLAITSLETLFIYSGYAVLPSSIVLAGMARRTDAHFVTAASGSQSCNFGHWGILDFVLGTSCQDTASIFEDLQDEAHKHRLEERAQKAARGALDGLNEERQESASDPESERGDAASSDGGEGTAYGADGPAATTEKSRSRGVADEGMEPAEQAPVKRRSARRKAQ
ncbi:hypothetical protein Q7P35_010129 [Cladosporium inversicolor]